MGAAFELEEARARVPALRRHVDELGVMRADLVTARATLLRAEGTPVGGLAEVKALEARLHEAVEWFALRGIQLKGVAPVIVDFPSELDGDPVLLCWLEGEASLGWYHSAEAGFMGRRRLPGPA